MSLPIPRARRAAVALSILAIAATAAACSGGGDDSPAATGDDLTVGLSATELLERSGEAAAELESFRAAFAVEGTADADQLGAPELQMLTVGGIDISGEGPVVAPDSASLDIALGVAGLTSQANVTRSGDVVALTAFGQEIGLSLSSAELELLNPIDLYPRIAALGTEPTLGEPAQIEGTPTVEVRAPLDIDRVADELVGTTAPAGSSAALTTWVDTATLAPRRWRVELSDGAGALDARITVDMTDLNAPATIPVPDPAQIVRPEQLGSLIGG